MWTPQANARRQQQNKPRPLIVASAGRRISAKPLNGILKTAKSCPTPAPRGAVEVRWSDGNEYAARITAEGPNFFRVQFLGWNDKSDELLTFAALSARAPRWAKSPPEASPRTPRGPPKQQLLPKQARVVPSQRSAKSVRLPAQILNIEAPLSPGRDQPLVVACPEEEVAEVEKEALLNKKRLLSSLEHDIDDDEKEDDLSDMEKPESMLLRLSNFKRNQNSPVGKAPATFWVELLAGRGTLFTAANIHVLSFPSWSLSLTFQCLHMKCIISMRQCTPSSVRTRPRILAPACLSPRRKKLCSMSSGQRPRTRNW